MRSKASRCCIHTKASPELVAPLMPEGTRDCICKHEACSWAKGEALLCLVMHSASHLHAARVCTVRWRGYKEAYERCCWAFSGAVVICRSILRIAELTVACRSAISIGQHELA
jgi:hypothetical protein